MAQLIDHIFSDPPRSNRTGEVRYSGDVLTTTNGDLSAVAANVSTPFFTLTKVGSEAGRYRVQLTDSRGNAVVAKKLTSWNFGVNGAADAAYTTAKGIKGVIRNNTISTTGTFDIQFVRTDTAADAEVEDGATIWVEFCVKKSSAQP